MHDVIAYVNNPGLCMHDVIAYVNNPGLCMHDVIVTNTMVIIRIRMPIKLKQ